MYFPTLVEVPIANMFLSPGMHPGPLLAYPMADPELSLQSILMISAIISRRKAWVYVLWVALFSTLAGLLYGMWKDGLGTGWIALYLAGSVGLLALALGLGLVDQRHLTSAAAHPSSPPVQFDVYEHTLYNASCKRLAFAERVGAAGSWAIRLHGASTG